MERIGLEVYNSSAIEVRLCEKKMEPTWEANAYRNQRANIHSRHDLVWFRRNYERYDTFFDEITLNQPLSGSNAHWKPKSSKLKT